MTDWRQIVVNVDVWCADFFSFFFFNSLLLLISFLTLTGQIRKRMIDAETGSYTISTLVKSQDEVI